MNVGLAERMGLDLYQKVATSFPPDNRAEVVARQIRSSAPQIAANVEGDLETCVAALTKTGHRVAYVDLTTPDVAYAGMHAVRTIAAGLQPIHFGFGQERFGGSRIFQAAKLLGFAESARGVNDLNPCPHPLA